VPFLAFSLVTHDVTSTAITLILFGNS